MDFLFRSSNGSSQINLPVGDQVGHLHVTNKGFCCFFPNIFGCLIIIDDVIFTVFLFSGSHSLIVRL